MPHANHRLRILPGHKFGAREDFPASIGGRGTGLGQFEYVSSVVCDGTALYATDANHRVQKFRLADGAPLGTVGTKGDGERQFCRPISLLFVATDVLYVCDGENGRIVVLGTDLSWRLHLRRDWMAEGYHCA